MHIIIEFLLTTKNILVAFFFSWVYFFITPPKKDVEKEIVLVTGAGNGIGRELCIRFAHLGAIVVLWDLDDIGMEKTLELIAEVGGVGHSYICDVGDRDQVVEIGAQVKEDVGDVNIVVNNAAIVVGKKFVDLTPEEIEATFNTNLLGVIWVTKQFLPSMIENNHGHIVNIASSCGLIGLAQLCDYSASKSGVIGFTEVLNYEMVFGGYAGVHTTVVCPSYVKTNMFKGCRMAYPSILSDLELDPTVTQIMNAILTNQSHLYIPRLVYFIAVLKTLMPSKALMEFIQFCKADKFMDLFIGHPSQVSTSSVKSSRDSSKCSKYLPKSSKGSSSKDSVTVSKDFVGPSTSKED